MRFARATRPRELTILLASVAGILLIGTLFYHHTEHWRILDALYFCVITLTTVGYGDITPNTDAGKIFTIVYIFLGLGIILTFITIIARNATWNYVKMTEGYVKKSEEYFEEVVKKALRKS